MSEPSTSGLSLELQLRVIDVKYGYRYFTLLLQNVLYNCGNEDTALNSVNLMNILREYPAKYTCSKVLDHKEPVPTV